MAGFVIVYIVYFRRRTIMGRGLLLWLIGVPIPVILLLWLFFGAHSADYGDTAGHGGSERTFFILLKEPVHRYRSKTAR